MQNRPHAMIWLACCILFQLLLLHSVVAAPLCGQRVLRNIEFSGRECGGTCRVLHKRLTFIGDKILFGETSENTGTVLLQNGETDLQSDQFNIPFQPGDSFPNTRAVASATSQVQLPRVSLSIRRQLLSASNQIVAEHRETLDIQLNEQCDACRIIDYHFTFVTQKRNTASIFQQYSCRASTE
jgi:hypothetical protein